MGLITNSKDSLYGGVNQQSAEHRMDNQVEEMINVVPTIDRGLLKRNPTVRKELSEDIDYTSEIWNYEYDRGTAGDSEEQYALSITQQSGLEIVNINTGEVYNEPNGGISMSQSAIDYLYPFVGGNGYAATTVKDTTFLVNKSVYPRLDANMYDPEDTQITEQVHVATIPYDATPSPTITGSGDTWGDDAMERAAPMSGYIAYCYRCNPHSKLYKSRVLFNSAKVTITVDAFSVISFSDPMDFKGGGGSHACYKTPKPKNFTDFMTRELLFRYVETYNMI